LGGLENLRFLSLSNNLLTGVEPLANLDQLQSLFLDNNRIGDIDAFAGQRIVDDGEAGYTETSLIPGLPSGWQGNLSPTTGALGEDYRFHPGNGATATAQATWTFENLEAGSYEVLVTWAAHDSHASNARFTVVSETLDAGGALAESSQASRVNQRLAPSGPLFGGRLWQSLGIFATDGTTLRVELTDDADGTVIADAVRLVAVDPATKQPLATLPNLRSLVLTGSPLDNTAQLVIAPQLAARDAADPNFVFSFTADQGLQWQTILGPQGMAQGGTLLLTLAATDADAGDQIYYTAASDRPDISTTVVGNKLTLTGASNYVGTARITVVAQDGPSGPGDFRGRSVEQTFDLNVGVSAITGTKWQDTDDDGVRNPGEPGVEGITVFRSQRQWPPGPAGDAGSEYALVRGGRSLRRQPSGRSVLRLPGLRCPRAALHQRRRLGQRRDPSL
jgi:hypothetical protein